MGQKVLGVDVGGTFTDLILADGVSNEISIAKVPTTLDNQAFGVMSAINMAGANLAEIDSISHGTTTTTNALLERKIAKLGLITTKGFRDVLELGRRTRPSPYGLKGQFKPLINREYRLEVDERMDADGNILQSLNESDVEQAVKQLLAMGAESIVIHFLHSYKNNAHEKRALEIVRRLWPNDYVTAGHEILSEYREYERGTTAAVNGAIRPVLHKYIERLQSELSGKGFAHELLVMQGNGGSVSSGIVSEQAVNTVMSGPASGVMAAAATCRAANIDKVITYDMGGTSSDVGLVEGGVPQVTSEMDLEYAMPIHVPMVDVHTIGAGGGSLASINNAGMLQVGPHSAGATPGPICYGRGGEKPTITDANLVLGRLNPDGLLSVDNPVSMDQVKSAIVAEVGSLFEEDPVNTAAAILKVGNNKMASAIRMVSLSRGHDPRDFALFAFGGAGPLHAVALAKELGIPNVMIPARPGITNALGCIVSDLRHDFVKTVNTPLKSLDIADVQNALRQQLKEGQEMLDRDGVTVDHVEYVFSADMQFVGQTHLLSVSISGPEVTLEELQQKFDEAYWSRFAVELPEVNAALVNLHTAILGKRDDVDLSILSGNDQKSTIEEAQVSLRSVWYESGWQDTPIYDRALLPRDAKFTGPAIVEQMDTTIVIEPGDHVVMDAIGNLMIEVSL